MRDARTSGRILVPRLLLVPGLALVLLAILAPSHWLVGGATIVRSLLAVEGMALATAGALGISFTPLAESARLAAPRAERPHEVATDRVLIALGLVTLLGLALRLIHLGDDLWLDEIVTVREYASGSVRHILSTYTAPNNHFLNSLLVHFSVRWFGYREWAIRLPALVWGVATIPVLYRTARRVFDPARSLAAAFLLAVSYQHVYFSQNARGYTASLFFGLAATALLLDGLQGDRLRTWVLYVVSAVLCIVAVPTGAFVVAGQLVVAAASLVLAWRRDGRAARRLLGRLVVVYAAVAMVAMQVYAPVIARFSGAVQNAWNTNAAGFKPLSLGFVRQLGQGFTSGVGPLLLVVAVPVGLVGLAGAWSFFRRDWALAVGLTLGPLLHVAVVVVRGLAFSPRFLLFLAFPAILAVVETVRLVAGLAARLAGRRGVAVGTRWPAGLETGAVLVTAAVLAVPLVRYYRVQKQPYREALARAEAPGVAIIAADNMEQGVRYYGIEHPGRRRPLRPGVDVFFVRSTAALDRALADAKGRQPVVLTTLERALRTGRPKLYARILSGWVRSEHLSGSIGDGGITIWRRR